MSAPAGPGRRSTIPFRLLLAALAVAAIAVAAGIAPNPLIAESTAFNRDVTIGMGVVYASLRVLKGVLQMAADANFSAGVAVVGFEGSPGQLVTPVIDTVERMANLVFALMIYSGVLAVLIPVVGSWAAGAVAAAAALLALFGVSARGPGVAAGALAAVRALLLIGLLGAVVLPGAYSLSALIGDQYLRDAGATAELETLTEPYRQSQDQIVQTPVPGAEAQPAPQTPAPADQNIWDYLTSQIRSAIESIGGAGAGITDAVRNFGMGTLDQIGASISSVGDAIEKAEDLLNLLVSLAVAYIFKLIVLPVLTIAAVVFVARVGLAGMRSGR